MEVFAKFKNEINRVIIEIPMGYEKGNDLMGLNRRIEAYDRLANLMGEKYVGECILLSSLIVLKYAVFIFSVYRTESYAFHVS